MKKLTNFEAVWFLLAVVSPTLAWGQEQTVANEDEEQPAQGAAEEDESPGRDANTGEGPTVAEEPLQEPEPPAQEGDCSNGVDDDEDGDADCNDYDCLDDESCYEVAEDDREPAPVPAADLGLQPAPQSEPGPDQSQDIADEIVDDDDDDDWEDRPVDMFEVHGYLRVRGDLFHELHMANLGPIGGVNYFHPRPNGDNHVICGGSAADPDRCTNSTFAGANMRFRLEPIINLGDQVRILSQIDLLDNLVLGSTPEGSFFGPDGSGGSTPWAPLRLFSGGQAAPQVRNSLTNALSVRRVWGEVATPLGQLHFGRMGSHWGLGMVANNGNGIDDDYGDSVDRIMLATRLWGILFVPGVEYVSSGKFLQTWGEDGGQPLDAGQLDDVMQYFLVVARQLNREEQEERMRRGDLVLNGGLYLTFRHQVLADENVDAFETGPGDTLHYRNGWALVPDLWFQMFYRGFHLELELAFVGGKVENYATTSANTAAADWEGMDIRQLGAVARADFTALNGQLNAGVEFGYASGDAEMDGLTPRQTRAALKQQPGYEGSAVNSLFRFDPDFNVDLILFEQILGQISGAYYFRPWVAYEFIRNTVGARADVIYSLASQPIQTLGNSPHLGVELNASVWYRASAPHNFYTAVQYGILFPLNAWKSPYEADTDLEFPQTVQFMAAITY